jgi:hypothetical protein
MAPTKPILLCHAANQASSPIRHQWIESPAEETLDTHRACHASPSRGVSGRGDTANTASERRRVLRALEQKAAFSPQGRGSLRQASS